MEKWDGVVLDVNATCANLGRTVCSKLLGAHAITGCDTVSYPFGKSKASMLKTLKEGDFPGLFDVLGEEGASQEDLMAVGEQFFVALYGQPSGSSMTQARYNLYTRKQEKPMHNHVTAADRLESLPPRETSSITDAKVLWKAADQLGPPDVSITEYGWEIQDGNLSRKRTRWRTQHRTITIMIHENDRDEQDEDEDDQLAD